MTDDFNNKGEKKTSKTEVLDIYFTDLTKLAKENKIDPVFGRDEETIRLSEILSRRKKNNVIITGNQGIGKTSIAQNLALMIKEGRVPLSLANKRLLELNLTTLISGTKWRGELEERIKNIIDVIKNSNDIILFIDEIHNLVGAGGAAGSMDISNMLKPALASGEMSVIGATTIDEYRKYFEKDGALNRRFQQLNIEEPSVDDTILIIESLKSRYEDFHKVTFSKEVVIESVKLADRYMNGKFFPDKAIDIIDETGAACQIKIKPPKFITDIEEKLSKIKVDKINNVKLQDYEKAANLRDLEKELINELKTKKDNWKESLNNKKVEITIDDIYETVGKITGIPLKRLTTNDNVRLISIESELKKEIIGQDNAIEKIAQAVRRNKVGFRDKNKPGYGVFFFLGSTGSGKSYLSKKIAEKVFGSKKNIIRIDMGEYSDSTSVNKLIGSSNGYVGYEEGGILTKQVLNNPYSVILLDEIEKAHDSVFNLLLPLLDEGHLTDNQGRVVSFKNCMIIMTSNIGIKNYQEFKNKVGFETSSSDKENNYKDSILKSLNGKFQPEFLNRIDEVIVFNSLNKDETKKIVELELNKLVEITKEMGYVLKYTPDIIDLINDQGFIENLGARPLNRAIERLIQNKLSDHILINTPQEGKILKLKLDKNKEVRVF